MLSFEMLISPHSKIIPISFLLIAEDFREKNILLYNIQVYVLWYINSGI